MYSKILFLFVSISFLISCGSKAVVSAPVTEAKPVEVALTPELAEGKLLFQNNCANCHKLYDPKDFSSEQWQPILKKMQKKARVTDVEIEKIYKYVTN